ncbi:MAG: hypothetical protein R2774_13740 [Saprospiraceae bacterium]
MTQQKEPQTAEPNLKKVKIGDESYLLIENIDDIRPFFMSIVSDSDVWLFVTSNGGITSGRMNAQHALFPYYTDDKLIENADKIGSKTIIKINNEHSSTIWQPFDKKIGTNVSQRNLYKSTLGNSIIFEEIRSDLGLSFQYHFKVSQEDGLIKYSKISNLTNNKVNLDVIDGLANILPADVPSDLQNKASNLIDAYRKTELLESNGFGIFALSAIITDKSEPAEALFANVVYSIGLKNPKYLLSLNQFQNFIDGVPLKNELEMNGEKGGYYITSKILLDSNQYIEWMIIGDVHLSQSQIIRLQTEVEKQSDHELWSSIENRIKKSSHRLTHIVANADGLQKTNDDLCDTRHYNNVLFNCMRGGIFDYNYKIYKWDLLQYISKRNFEAYPFFEQRIQNLGEIIDYSEFKEVVREWNEKDSYRHLLEYLPIRFSRRHGDPSRPWNIFNIRTLDKQSGNKILNFEGNWRDIFQNWEALLWSYPYFVEGVLFRFFNATTFDGYNPYRITKTGIDWEVVEPDDPWSFIGYWGDHQIIYLLKLLEFASDYQPDLLQGLSTKLYFVYANVPYKIHTYEQICSNPKDTITFDENLDRKIRVEYENQGTDAAVLRDRNKSILYVNMVEKMLATLLAKMSNFIPGAGIWMNTQRPEWNDANNALVGNGTSMVTLYYMKRYVLFFQNLLSNSIVSNFDISNELLAYFNEINSVFAENVSSLKQPHSATLTKSIIDSLGKSASDYRWLIYNSGFTGQKSQINTKDVLLFLTLILEYIDNTINLNKRSDGLYHGYNLISYDNSRLDIQHLDIMLEAQVGILSAHHLHPNEAIDLLEKLYQSDLYRVDQDSFLLYPNKRLDSFLRKNLIDIEILRDHNLLEALPLLTNLNILEKDVNGNYHFAGHIINSRELKEQIKNHHQITDEISSCLLALHEKTFNHKYFTGRSGTFYGYEGLGSIYWHMVSKLRLAVIEVLESAHKDDSLKKEDFVSLVHYYYKICDGIGTHKSPDIYGAFPTDPYSHTPSNKGAQQPGMTGQVKEDILSRWKELGVSIKYGRLSFSPFILKLSEFMHQSGEFSYFDVDGEMKSISYPTESIIFTYCQIPVIYVIGSKMEVTMTMKDGSNKSSEGQNLNIEDSKQIFQRSGSIQAISVTILQSQLLASNG